MILLLTILFIELVLLFFLSDRLTKTLYTIFYTFFRNTHVAAGILTFLYLPGTAIHELAHLITAEVLRVPTGELSFTPEIVRHDSGQHEIKAGYLKIANTDPLRRFMIGIAPLIFGLMFTFVIVWLFQYFWPQLTQISHRVGLIVVTGYLLFALSNNMFSSRADMEGAQYFLPVVLLVAAVLYLMGLRIDLTDGLLTTLQHLLGGLTRALGIVIGLNISILLTNSLLLKLLNK